MLRVKYVQLLVLASVPEENVFCVMRWHKCVFAAVAHQYRRGCRGHVLDRKWAVDVHIHKSFGFSAEDRKCHFHQKRRDPIRFCLIKQNLIDAFKRASAGRITAVIPYFGYARQDRKAKSRDPISAKLVADLITKAGADRVLTMDLHAAQIQGFFDIPVDHLLGVPILAPYFQEMINNGKEITVVSPDLGSVTRARNFASKINAPLAIVDKRRQQANVCEVMNIIGNVEGRRVVLVDDMIDTAGTLCNAAKALVDVGGATEVYACATHGVLSGPALERIEASPIKKLVLLDTIDLPADRHLDKITYLPVAPIFAKAIEKVYEDEPISVLYN